MGSSQEKHTHSVSHPAFLHCATSLPAWICAVETGWPQRHCDIFPKSIAFRFVRGRIGGSSSSNSDPGDAFDDEAIWVSESEILTSPKLFCATTCGSWDPELPGDGPHSET